MNKKLALILACCVAGSFVACNESVEWKPYEEACTEGAKICKDGNVQECKEGVYEVVKECKGDTPICDPSKVDCVAKGTTKTCDVEKKCENGKLMVCKDGDWSVKEDCAGNSKICDEGELVCKTDDQTPKSCTVGEGADAVTLESGKSICFGGKLVTCDDGSTTDAECNEGLCRDGEEACSAYKDCTIGEGEDAKTVKHGEKACMTETDSTTEADIHLVATCNDGDLEKVNCTEDNDKVCMYEGGDYVCQEKPSQSCTYEDAIYIPNATICAGDKIMKCVVEDGAAEGTMTLLEAPDQCTEDQTCKLDETSHEPACVDKVFCTLEGNDTKFDVDAKICDADGKKILVCGEDGQFAELTEGQCTAEEICVDDETDGVSCKENKYTTIKAIHDDFVKFVDETTCKKGVCDADADNKVCSTVEAANVEITGLVIGFRSNQKTLFIQDMSGDNGQYSGMTVYCNDKCAEGLNVGDMVKVTADGIGQYYCQIQIQANGETGFVTVEKLTDVTPLEITPTNVAITDINTADQIHNPYNGTLVKLSGVKASAFDNKVWTFKSVSDESETIKLRNYLMNLAADTFVVDKEYTIVGIANYYNENVLFPRNEEGDIVEGGGETTDVCAEGESGVKCMDIDGHAWLVTCMNGVKSDEYSMDCTDNNGYEGEGYCDADLQDCKAKCTVNQCDEYDPKRILICDTDTGILAPSVDCEKDSSITGYAIAVCDTTTFECVTKCEKGYKLDGSECVEDPDFCEADDCKNGKIRECDLGTNTWKTSDYAFCPGYGENNHTNLEEGCLSHGFATSEGDACNDEIVCDSETHPVDNAGTVTCELNCTAEQNSCDAATGVLSICGDDGAFVTSTCNSDVAHSVPKCATDGSAACELACDEANGYEIDGNECKLTYECVKSACSDDELTLLACDLENHTQSEQTCAVSATHADNAAWTSKCVATETSASCEDVCADGYSLNSEGECELNHSESCSATPIVCESNVLKHCKTDGSEYETIMDCASLASGAGVTSSTCSVDNDKCDVVCESPYYELSSDNTCVVKADYACSADGITCDTDGKNATICNGTTGIKTTQSCGEEFCLESAISTSAPCGACRSAADCGEVATEWECNASHECVDLKCTEDYVHCKDSSTQLVCESGKMEAETECATSEHCVDNKGCIECESDGDCSDNKTCNTTSNKCEGLEIAGCNFQAIDTTDSKKAYGRINPNGKSVDDYEAQLVCSDGTNTVVIEAVVNTECDTSSESACMTNKEFMSNGLPTVAGNYSCAFMFKLKESAGGSQGWFACDAVETGWGAPEPTSDADSYASGIAKYHRGLNVSAAPAESIHSTDFEFIQSEQNNFNYGEGDDEGKVVIDGVTLKVKGKPFLTNGTKNYAIDGKGIIISTEKKSGTGVFLTNMTSGVGTLEFDCNGWDDATVVVTPNVGTAMSFDCPKSTNDVNTNENAKHHVHVFNSEATAIDITSVKRVIIDNLAWTYKDVPMVTYSEL